MEVEAYIDEQEESVRAILIYFHRYLQDELGLIPKIRFKIPFYYRNSWICYLNPTKRNTVDVSFIRGNELLDESQILDDKGRKQVTSIEITSIVSAPIDALKELIIQAVILDESKPYKLKRHKK